MKIRFELDKAQKLQNVNYMHSFISANVRTNQA